MKPFLIDRHARFTEVLSSSVLLWRILQAFFSMFAHMLKLKRIHLVTVGVKTLWAKSSCWRPTNPAQSLPCVPALRLVGRRNLISYWSSRTVEWGFDSRDSSSDSTNCSSLDAFKPLRTQQGFLERLRLFSLILLLSWTQWRLIFFLFRLCQFLA